MGSEDREGNMEDKDGGGALIVSNIVSKKMHICLPWLPTEGRLKEG